MEGGELTNKEGEKKPNNIAPAPVKRREPNKTLDILKYILVILAICSLGLFVLNQIFKFHYQTEFLKTPCQLCAELNPDVKECMIMEQTLYPDGKGGWTNDTTKSYQYNYSGLKKIIINNSD